MKTKERIIEECDKIKEMLLQKNLKYGDSALNPIRIFSKDNAVEQLKVRLDDKLSRIKNNDTLEDEDVILDMIGYLVLLRIGLLQFCDVEVDKLHEETTEELIMNYIDINRTKE